MKRFLLVAALVLSPVISGATASEGDYLVQMAPSQTGILSQLRLKQMVPAGSQIESLGINGWFRVKVPAQSVGTFQVHSLLQNKDVNAVEANRRLSLMNTLNIRGQVQVAAMKARQRTADNDNPFPFPFPGDGNGGGDGDNPFPFPFPGDGNGGGDGDNPFPFPFPGDGNGGGGGGGGGSAISDNPAIPPAANPGSGADPLFNKQWGMNQIGVRSAWEKSRGNPELVVAVIDTGVDYTHEDLLPNMWRNPGETGTDAQGKDKASNGVDDDGNGFIDDIVGWDFVSNDNKPYDLYANFNDIISGNGQPGHGTHCAGNVAARGDNGKGIAGVAPNVKIMALRFLSEKGSGTTADAIKAIKYGVDNGAKVLSNSWGSSGEGDAQESAALKDAIRYSESKGVLFVAAAGNGDQQGRGYDNDSSRQPAFPASYDMESIVSVAAIDERGNLGTFSNWGRRTVDIGAPGVKVFSTVPANRYQDSIGSFLGQQINWDGTSMATPHVAGAAALYWSAHPEKNWREVKAALLNSVKKTNVLANKTVSGGQLDVQALMNQ